MSLIGDHGVSARRAVRHVGVTLLDIVYPRRCPSCRQRGAWVCAECLDETELFQEPVCAGCGVPLALHACHCTNMASGLAQVRSVGPFSGWLREAILNFKYHDEWARAEHLGLELAQVVATMPPVDALVPVPLHRSRLRSRGYNQSALLANVAGDIHRVPVLDAISRTRSTAQQTTLSAAERAANVAGAFALAPGFDPAGRSLLLIDDVVTTGSTLNACAELLAEHGAAVVRAVTLARQL